MPTEQLADRAQVGVPADTGPQQYLPLRRRPPDLRSHSWTPARVREFLISRRARSPRSRRACRSAYRRVPGLRPKRRPCSPASASTTTPGGAGQPAASRECPRCPGARPALDDAERAHLFDLARGAGRLPPRRAPPPACAPGRAAVIDAMTEAPALVQNGRRDVLATNRLGYALYSEMDITRPAGEPRPVRLPRPALHPVLLRVGSRRRRHRRDAAHRSRPRPARPQPDRPRR